MALPTQPVFLAKEEGVGLRVSLSCVNVTGS
jgi:hypothetical protein